MGTAATFLRLDLGMTTDSTSRDLLRSTQQGDFLNPHKRKLWCQAPGNHPKSSTGMRKNRGNVRTRGQASGIYIARPRAPSSRKDVPSTVLPEHSGIKYRRRPNGERLKSSPKIGAFFFSLHETLKKVFSSTMAQHLTWRTSPTLASSHPQMSACNLSPYLSQSLAMGASHFSCGVIRPAAFLSRATVRIQVFWKHPCGSPDTNLVESEDSQYPKLDSVKASGDLKPF